MISNNQPVDNESDPLETHYILKQHSTTNEARFGISHLYTTISIMANNELNDYDEIIPGSLFLGTIPSRADAEQLRKNIANLGMVCSTLEPFELNGSAALGKFSIQSPADWKKIGIKHYLLIVPDFTADVDVRLLYKMLLAMHEEISKTKAIYIHCKAGRGRSATAVAAYLLIFKPPITGLNEKSTAEDAVKFLQSKRSQVRLGTEQLDKIKEVYLYHQALQAKKIDSITHRTKNYDDIHDYLCSYEGKEKIAQLPYIKELLLYASEKQNSLSNSNRCSLIQSFFTQIYTGSDRADWYIDLLNNQGPLQKLLDARPYYGVFNSGAPYIRKIIVEGIKEELAELVMQTFNYEQEAYNKVIQAELNTAYENSFACIT